MSSVCALLTLHQSNTVSVLSDLLSFARAAHTFTSAPPPISINLHRHIYRLIMQHEPSDWHWSFMLCFVAVLLYHP